MITKKTFPTIIVPIIAPTWRNAARGANSRHDAYADADEREDEHGKYAFVVRKARQSPS